MSTGAESGPRPAGRRQRRPAPRHLVGASPGTLRVDAQALPPRLAVVSYAPGRVDEKAGVSLEEVEERRRRSDNLWLDVTGFGDVRLLERLAGLFGLHRLALEDVLNPHQRAKVEDFGTHEFLLVRMVDAGGAQGTEQFAMFVGPGFVVTFQERPGDCFDPVRARLRDPAGQMQKRGTDYLAYALLDAVVDAYFPMLESLGERLERVEERILERAAQAGVVHELYEVRRCLLEVRRAVWPLREAMSSLVRGEVPHFGADVRVYLRDVQDHVVQLLDFCESYREIGSSLFDLHLSAVNHRLNEVMKVLTVIATIFIPLTFVVGVYGMNFDWMPELRVWWGYPACLLAMAALAIGMLWWFHRKRWL